MAISIQTTDFNHNYHHSYRAGNSLHGYYDLHNFDVYNEIIVNGRRLSAVYQTGVSYLYNSYDCPNDDVELSSDGGADRILRIVNSMTESDLDDSVEYYLDEIDDELISSPEDLSSLYFALRENNDQARDYFRELVEDESFSPDFIES